MDRAVKNEIFKKVKVNAGKKKCTCQFKFGVANGRVVSKFGSCDKKCNGMVKKLVLKGVIGTFTMMKIKVTKGKISPKQLKIQFVPKKPVSEEESSEESEEESVEEGSEEGESGEEESGEKESGEEGSEEKESEEEDSEEESNEEYSEESGNSGESSIEEPSGKSGCLCIFGDIPSVEVSQSGEASIESGERESGEEGSEGGESGEEGSEERESGEEGSEERESG